MSIHWRLRLSLIAVVALILCLNEADRCMRKSVPLSDWAGWAFLVGFYCFGLALLIPGDDQ